MQLSSFELALHCLLCQILLPVFTKYVFGAHGYHWIRVMFLLLHIISVFACSYRSGHLGNWRKTATSSYQVIARDRLILPLTSISCYLDFTNTCSPTATSIPAQRYTVESAIHHEQISSLTVKLYTIVLFLCNYYYLIFYWELCSHIVAFMFTLISLFCRMTAV